MRKVIIQGNAVYEIDEECLKKKEEQIKKEEEEQTNKTNETEKGCC